MRTLFGAVIPFAAAAALVLAAPYIQAPADASENGLRSGTAQTIQVGYVTGIAYYTAHKDGYHVVATLSVAGGAPVRVKATLQPEQAVSFSVPGAEGTLESAVEFARRGDDLLINNPTRLVLN